MKVRREEGWKKMGFVRERGRCRGGEKLGRWREGGKTVRVVEERKYKVMEKKVDL